MLVNYNYGSISYIYWDGHKVWVSTCLNSKGVGLMLIDLVFLGAWFPQ